MNVVEEVGSDEEPHQKSLAQGGLGDQIDEVASNVTYVKAETKIVGERQTYEGRLSMKEYEALSNKKGRDSGLDVDFIRSPTDMLSVDVGGQDMNAIQEKDGIQEEGSMETVRIDESTTGKWKRPCSPGRLFKAPGVDE